MARSARTILAALAVVLVTTAAASRDPSVRVDPRVIESIGPLPPAPRAPAGAPRATGMPLAPDTVPQAAPPRRPTQRARPAPARRTTSRVAPSLPLPLPPEEPAEPPPLAAPAPLPLPPEPPPMPAPPAAVAAPAPATPPPPTLPGPAAGPPPVVQAPAPAPPAEVAARPPAAASAAAAPAARVPPAGPLPERVQLLFPPGAQELSESMRGELRALAAALPEDEALRLTVNAYAGGDPANPSLARRASLSRALAVRTALMEAGVRSTRIDVRALGLSAGDGPADRVDVLVGPPR